MVTIVVRAKNDAVFVRDWVVYHTSIFGLDNIFAFDYGSTDGTLDILNDMKVTTHPASEKTIKEVFRSILDSPNEIVFVLNANEFVVSFRQNLVSNDEILESIKELPSRAVYRMNVVEVPCSAKRPLLQATQGVEGTPKFFYNTNFFQWQDTCHHGEPSWTPLGLVRYELLTNKNEPAPSVDVTPLTHRILHLTTKKGILGVVARYNESLDWMLEVPFNQIQYVVYNKGPNDDFCKTNVVAVVDLPNVGRCDHTYLYHIVKEFAQLDDMLVFLPGSCGTPYKKERAVATLNHTVLTGKPCMVLFDLKDVRTTFADFTLSEWQCTEEENKAIND